MLRYSSRIRILQNRKINVQRGSECYQSSIPPRGKKVGTAEKALIFGGGTAAILSGVVGYAGWSTENQKVVQEYIPGSKFLIEPILGPIVEPPKKPIEKPKPIPEGLLLKKIEREKKEKENEVIQDKSQAENATKEAAIKPPPPPPLAPPPTTATVVEESTQEINMEPSSTNTDIETKLSVSEEESNAKNTALTILLEEKMSEAEKRSESALKAAEVAAAAARTYTEKAYAAIDTGEGEEQLFAIAAEISKIKSELIQTAEMEITTAKDAVTDLRNAVSSGIESKSTQDNPFLQTAEDKVSELIYSTSKANSILGEALRDSSAINEFKDLVFEGRKQFEAEVRALTPDVKLGEKADKLTVEELNLLLAHAHRKVLAVQRSLAKQQTLDKGRFKDSMLRQRDQEARFLEGRLHAELERQKHELGMEYRHRLQQIKEDNESEMRLQLKRQAAAHSDHLSDVLLIQEKELDRKWKVKLQDDLQSARDDYHISLSKIDGQLSGLKTAMTTRVEVDKAAHAAHELWMACQSLKSTLRLGKENARSWENKLQPLGKQINTIRNVAGDGNVFIETVLSAIPEEAKSRGVYSRDALRERFMKIERICKRVSMIGDNGASLVRYLLSYIQSFLIFNSFEYLSGREKRNEKVFIDRYDTYGILSRARYSLERDDLLQAIQYMNLLRGEARHVASDWVNEARLSMEAQLVADALMAHATATGARAL